MPGIHRARTLSSVVAKEVKIPIGIPSIAKSIRDMSITDDDTLSTADNNTDNYLIPTTSDKQRIIYIDNDATIEGILYEIGTPTGRDTSKEANDNKSLEGSKTYWCEITACGVASRQRWTPSVQTPAC